MTNTEIRNHPPADLEPLSFTTGEAAAILGVKRQTIRKRVMAGKLHPIVLGKVRFARSELERARGRPLKTEDIWAAQQKARAEHRAERGEHVAD